MKQKKTLLITGAAGDIGQGIARYFNNKDWNVVGLDKNIPKNKNFFVHFIKADLLRFVENSSYQKKILSDLNSTLTKGLSIDCLINNAATQIIKPALKLSAKDFDISFSVNSIAPFILSNHFYNQLKRNKGNIINISSIHGKLTLHEFCAYAASKSALDSITRTLSIEFGGKVRVNAIAPAAIETKMLKAGLKSNQSYRKISRTNPSLSIGSVKDVASLAYTICNNHSTFFSGSIIDLNGGIGNLLHH